MLLVRNFFQYVISFYPDEIRHRCETEIPALSLAAGRLALEVIDAEMHGRPYSDAVLDPSYPLMSRVHFGVADTLMWRVPEEMISAFCEMIQRAAEGDFDPVRQLIFALATRRNDPEAALCRFFLWQAIRMNLLVGTWDEPVFEARGLLRHTEIESEKILKEFLEVPDMLCEDVRPLNVLVRAAVDYLDLSTTQVHGVFERYCGSLEELVAREEVLQLARRLDQRSAAVLWPGESLDELGSQRIADRYPQHFRTANGVEAQRTRTLKRLGQNGVPEPSGDRLIDLIRQTGTEAL
jgi:hypothetical protein